LKTKKTVARKINHIKDAIHTPAIKNLQAYKDMDALKPPRRRDPSIIACGLSQVTVKQPAANLYKVISMSILFLES
jgi:hypothetical protein